MWGLFPHKMQVYSLHWDNHTQFQRSNPGLNPAGTKLQWNTNSHNSGIYGLWAKWAYLSLQYINIILITSLIKYPWNPEEII